MKRIDETIYNLNFGGSKRRSEREWGILLSLSFYGTTVPAAEVAAEAAVAAFIGATTAIGAVVISC